MNPYRPKKKLKEIPSDPVVEEEVAPAETAAAPKPEGAADEDGDAENGEDGAGNFN